MECMKGDNSSVMDLNIGKNTCFHFKWIIRRCQNYLYMKYGVILARAENYKCLGN